MRFAIPRVLVAIAFACGMAACATACTRGIESSPVRPVMVKPLPPGTVAATEALPAGFAAAQPPSAMRDYAARLSRHAKDRKVTPAPNAWYPSRIPSGFRLESIETTELDPAVNSGPVCDIVFARGSARIHFSQGSPIMRDYEVVSAGTTPWGWSAADVMLARSQDDVDSIVYIEPGDLAELSGDVGIDQLKAIAAGMQAVD